MNRAKSSRSYIRSTHLAPLLGLAACSHAVSGEPSMPADSVDAADRSPCSRPGDSYVQGLRRSSSAGTFTVRLLDIDPAPPVMGRNRWRFQLSDDAQAPISGATVVVTSFMPDHAHAGPSVDVSERGQGEYEATMDVVLMSGLYRFQIALGGDFGDRAAYEFCVR